MALILGGYDYSSHADTAAAYLTEVTALADAIVSSNSDWSRVYAATYDTNYVLVIIRHSFNNEEIAFVVGTGNDPLDVSNNAVASGSGADDRLYYAWQPGTGTTFPTSTKNPRDADFCADCGASKFVLYNASLDLRSSNRRFNFITDDTYARMWLEFIATPGSPGSPYSAALFSPFGAGTMFKMTFDDSDSITGVTTGTKTFTIDNDHTSDISAGDTVEITGSTGNDGLYTVASVSLNVADTDVTVNETIPDTTVDGTMNFSLSGSMRNGDIYGGIMTGGDSNNLAYNAHRTWYFGIDGTEGEYSDSTSQLQINNSMLNSSYNSSQPWFADEMAVSLGPALGGGRKGVIDKAHLLYIRNGAVSAKTKLESGSYLHMNDGMCWPWDNSWTVT